MRTRTRRQPKTERTDGRVGRQSLQSVSIYCELCFALIQRLHQREGDGLADDGAGQRDEQSVDAHAEGLQEVLIDVAGLFVADELSRSERPETAPTQSNVSPLFNIFMKEDSL